MFSIVYSTSIFRLISLLNGISTFVGYIIPNPSLNDEERCTI